MQKNKQGLNKIPEGWYFMCPKKVVVSDLAAALDKSDYDIEVWNEAGVLVVQLDEKHPVDIEECELDMRDEYSNQYIKSNGINSLFYVSFKPESYDSAVLVVKKIMSKLGGMLCGDTDDFSPIIK